jgi:PAS domain S-box-containing protein/putative nucleotidyltransferase with HDIG domain
MTHDALDALDSVAVVLGLDGSILDANRAALDCYGHSLAEMLSLSIHDLRAPGDQTDIDTRMRQAAKTGVLFEAVHLRGDGSPFPAEVRSVPVLLGGVPALLSFVSDLTAQKQAAEELKDSESRYRALAETSPLAVFVFRNELDNDNVVLANPACVKLFGASSSEDLIGKSTTELFDPDSRALMRGGLREAGEKVSLAEAEIVRLDGTRVAVEVTASALLDQGVAAIQVVLHDITELKHAQQEQSHAEEFFRDTFEHADVGIAHVNSADGTWLRVNQRLCDLLGYTREELMQTTFAAITHPDDLELNMTHLRRMLAGDEETYAAEKRYVRKDGSIVWVHVNVAPIRKEDGTPDYNITVLTDIGERKQVEEALAASESRLKAMFDGAPSGIALIDSVTGRICEANPAYAKIAGRTVEELRELDWMSITHPDDMRASLDSVALLNDTGATVHTERRLVRPDGSTIWISMTDAPVLVGDAAHPQHVCMIQDITADKEAEELLALQTKRIERALTAVIDVAGSIGEARDPYTTGHQRRVAELASRIARDLGMSGLEVADINVAGLLHDIGKVGVPAEILSKPGTISPIEFELIKAHAEAGYRIALSAHMEEPIPELIYQHHERCDGSGYPRGLLGDQMLLGAKVLAVADVIEAMMSHRPYRPALGMEAALAEIEQGAGSLYDAEVSRACIALFRESGFDFS